jgi:hypothetical protein
MRRIGLAHDPADDFDRPMLAADHPMVRHALCRLSRDGWHELRDKPSMVA